MWRPAPKMVCCNRCWAGRALLVATGCLHLLLLVHGAPPAPPPAAAAPAPPAQRWQNWSLPIAVRVASLVGLLTRREKVAQLSGLDAPAVPRVGLPAYNYYGGDCGLGPI